MTSRLRAGILVLCAAIVMVPGGAVAPAAARASRLAVPVIQQSRERCGPAALEMVLRYYGADSAATLEAGRAYDPVLRGALITELAAAARRAGYQATVATLAPDSLIALLDAGVPPIVLYQNGRGPLTVAHYAVVTGWDTESGAFVVNDGGAKPRLSHRADLERRWRKAGSQALIVRRSAP